MGVHDAELGHVHFWRLAARKLVVGGDELTDCFGMLRIGATLIKVVMPINSKLLQELPSRLTHVAGCLSPLAEVVLGCGADYAHAVVCISL